MKRGRGSLEQNGFEVAKSFVVEASRFDVGLVIGWMSGFIVRSRWRWIPSSSLEEGFPEEPAARHDRNISTANAVSSPSGYGPGGSDPVIVTHDLVPRIVDSSTLEIGLATEV